MRKAIYGALTVASAALLAGCASTMPVGGVYTDVTLPQDAETGVEAERMGKAECSHILQLMATGDCSIEAAKQDGNIEKVSHVDWHAKDILGLFGTYTVKVYGK